MGVDFAISVEITILGCTDSGAANYDALATVDNDECVYIMVVLVIAENYNPDATNDDGSCEYISGCTDDEAINNLLSWKMAHVNMFNIFICNAAQ